MTGDFGVTVTPASAADVLDMSLIHKRAWVKAYEGLIEQSYLDRLQDGRWVRVFEKCFSEGTMTAWIAYIEGLPVACAGAGITPNTENGKELELISLYCLPEYWGKGAGYALMQRVKDHAYAEGYAQIALWVLEGNDRAIHFYEKEGFSDTGGRESIMIGEKEYTERRYVFSF